MRFQTFVSVSSTTLILFIFLLQEAKLVKVAIKSRSGDWCIRAKGLVSVTAEKCFWMLDEKSRKAQEVEQIFDVHPADVDEEERADYERPKPLTSFLIRLSSNSISRASSTTCLSSISSILSVAKCSLRKTRFRFSGLVSANSKYCPSSKEKYDNISYIIHSSDRLCLELETTNSSKESNFQHALTFTVCDFPGDHDPSPNVKSQSLRQLWQLCDHKGNCSLSPSGLNWNSMIETKWPSGENKSNCEIQKRETTTTPASTTVSATTITTTSTTIASTTTTTAAPTPSPSTTEIYVEPERQSHDNHSIISSAENSNSNENLLLPMKDGIGRVQPTPATTTLLSLCLLFKILY